MDTRNGSNGEALGAPPKVPTIIEVRQKLKNDLTVCINLLVAIRDDQDTREQLAEFLLGRFENHLHQEELKRQKELELK